MAPAIPQPCAPEGVDLLLSIKESDIRILTLEQCREAVDKGIHAGGAFSAIIPLVALYYGGSMKPEVVHPTTIGQDMFVLSKGHAIAALASIFADLGYFHRDVLRNSRSAESILNGHPGPLLPGIPVSTGPLGQGIGVAQGFAIRGLAEPAFRVYCMTGDGELQEGPVWETLMYSAHKRLGNFCLLVDMNHGQLDVHDRLIFPMENLAGKFESFGWYAEEVDARSLRPVLDALERFGNEDRDGRPTAIICQTTKGYGTFHSFLNKHKVVIPDEMMEEELKAQKNLRRERAQAYQEFLKNLEQQAGGKALARKLAELSGTIGVATDPDAGTGIASLPERVRLKRAPVRNRKIRYDPDRLPDPEIGKEYAAGEINSGVMREFARDQKVISVDADLASTSGLEGGIRETDPERALNVGVAEANMMNIGEAFAVLGHQVFVSTFCPFFDWKVLRRIAVGYQERMEDIASGQGWLSQGHGLDICFVATAPNFETRTNGATHMGNDDVTFFGSMAHLKIIDVSCPRLQVAVLKWIAEGNRGLVYMRIMRAPAPVIYHSEITFSYNRGYLLHEPASADAWIVSSGRGTHEALAAMRILEKEGVAAGVADMPSIDRELLLRLYDSKRPMLVAEQNNGFIWQALSTILMSRRTQLDNRHLDSRNTLGPDGRPRFIHSGTYRELTVRHGLDARSLADKVLEMMAQPVER